MMVDFMAIMGMDKFKVLPEPGTLKSLLTRLQVPESADALPAQRLKIEASPDATAFQSRLEEVVGSPIRSVALPLPSNDFSPGPLSIRVLSEESESTFALVRIAPMAVMCCQMSPSPPNSDSMFVALRRALFWATQRERIDATELDRRSLALPENVWPDRKHLQQLIDVRQRERSQFLTVSQSLQHTRGLRVMVHLFSLSLGAVHETEPVSPVDTVLVTQVAGSASVTPSEVITPTTPISTAPLVKCYLVCTDFPRAAVEQDSLSGAEAAVHFSALNFASEVQRIVLLEHQLKTLEETEDRWVAQQQLTVLLVQRARAERDKSKAIRLWQIAVKRAAAYNKELNAAPSETEKSLELALCVTTPHFRTHTQTEPAPPLNRCQLHLSAHGSFGGCTVYRVSNLAQQGVRKSTSHFWARARSQTGRTAQPSRALHQVLACQGANPPQPVRSPRCKRSVCCTNQHALR
mmetsp:Transcript_30511/g.71662  ORF Transcript_30511/g.71662 Transcript_30511/m.71662 type:complete len:464 (+) Transcript_30511:712-2103(+)